MLPLNRHLRGTLNILDGWTIGNLVIEDGVYLEQDDGRLLQVAPGAVLEVRNGDVWQRLTEADLQLKTVEGWPAYAGMDARVKPHRQ